MISRRSSPTRSATSCWSGPSSAGKTTLLETLLVRTGALTRAGTVADGTTVSDFEPGERAHGRSMSLAVAPLVHRGIKVNLIDTPGYADFVGELRAGLRAADCALFVVAANEPVDLVTTELWRECADVGMPRAVVVTKLDHARADYAGVLAAAQSTFGSAGDKVLPLVVPVMSGTEVTGLVGLLAPDVPDEHADDRDALIEGIIEESDDEGLMDRYLGGELVSEDALLEDLHRAMARGTFFPVVPACSMQRGGVRGAARPDRPRVPGPLGASAAPRPTPPRASRPTRSPATRTARCSPRSSRRRATRTSGGSAWSGCSPARSTPTGRCTSPDT